jgi:hypothetical protein
MDQDWIGRFRAALVGKPAAHVWRGYGSAIFVEFGALMPSASRREGARPEGECGLMIEWSWRLSEARSVLCGSWSEEDDWSTCLGRLIGQTVVDVQTFGQPPEILIVFSNGQSLASFMTAAGDPGWTLFDRRETHVAIGCEGGRIVPG